METTDTILENSTWYYLYIEQEAAINNTFKRGATFMRKGKLIIAVILCITTFMLAGCSSKEKEIELSKNVKQQLIDEENASIKLQKLNELDFGNEIYYPVLWKDDENIIATNSNENLSSSYEDINKQKEGDINIYNINIRTSQRTKLKTIEKAYCGDVGKQGFYGKFLFMKDNALWTYSAGDNSEKLIYDLTEAIKEFKEPGFGAASSQQTIKDSDILPKIKSGFVKGSDKYIYIMSYVSDGSDANQVLRILDLSTGKVYKNPYIKGLFDSFEEPYVGWVYSKVSDSFYACSANKGRLYEYNLASPNKIKNVRAMKGLISDITEDGDKLLLMAVNSSSAKYKNTTAIEQYNIKSKELTQLVYDKTKRSDYSKVSAYTGISINNNIVNYDVETITINKNKPTGIDHITYIGNYDGSSIKNVKTMPIEKVDNKGNADSIVFNAKGDKFIYSIYYFDQGEDYLKLSKIRSWVYEVK